MVKNAQNTSWNLYTDGAARNNPGPAGVGFVITGSENQVFKKGYYLGSKTNNQAEYIALIIGLYFLKNHINIDDKLKIYCDSELLVKQIRGEYKVKHANLKHLYALAMTLLKGLNFEIIHILRERNKVADQLANEAIDKKIEIPEFLKEAINFNNEI